MILPFGLLDTSVVIKVDELTPDDLPEEMFISTITLAELAIGPLAAADEHERAERQFKLQQASLDFGDPLPFDEKSALAYPGVAASLRQNGGKRKARSYDALIAATAKANQLPLYTCNAKDFVNIKGLHVMDVGPKKGSN